MLLAQKSYVEGSLALCLLAARLVDEQDALGNADSGLLLDLLTPIVKSFPSFYGPKANDLAIQVLAGAGYTREYPVEQCYRDNRLNPIHEGTHGIQSLDLLGRKLWQANGKGQQLLMAKVQGTLNSAANKPQLATLISVFKQHLNTFVQTTMTLGQALQQGEVKKGLANSALYLDMMGKLVIAWLWLEMADKAIETFSDSSDQNDQAFLAGKIQAAQYFIMWELPEIEHMAKLLNGFDSTCLEMQEAWF